MRVSDFDYHLPQELIAQHALEDRAASRLLHLVRATASWRDRVFRDLPGLLRAGDLLVLNNTRVFPARLFARRAGVRAQAVSARNPAARKFLQGKVEVLLVRQLGPREWQALVHPGRKIGVGERLFFGDPPQLEAEVIARGSWGERTLRFQPLEDEDFFAVVERLGHVPLPPYIARVDEPADRERYQTVFAQERGSVAAPTAGLHFTPETLRALADSGVETAAITLHVGLGTFQPVHVEEVERHRMHAETYEVSAAAAQAINRALSEDRRVVAVGTTTVRTLEHCAALDPRGQVPPGRGEAEIFIYPGHRFRVVSALLTNFHLPRSTLLMLVSAFAGRDLVLAAYRHAVQQRYRFYSYGDAMFIE